MDDTYQDALLKLLGDTIREIAVLHGHGQMGLKIVGMDDLLKQLADLEQHRHGTPRLYPGWGGRRPSA